MNKWKKPLLVGAISVIAAFILLILFISPILKYIIQKYDVKWTGREITLDWVYLNPLTGFVHVDDLIIHEFQRDDVFLSMHGLSVNLSMLKLFSGDYELSAVKFNKPVAYVALRDNRLNFADLIERFAPEDKEKTDTVHFSALNIKINQGEVHYDENQTPISFSIKNLELNSEGYRWDVDSIPVSFAFSSGQGVGEIFGDLSLNLECLDYRLAVQVERFDLDIINQYLNELTNYGSFKAFLDADIKSTGNLGSSKSVALYGNLAISDFHFGKDEQEDFAAFDQLVVEINALNPEKLLYDFDSIYLKKPFAKYELYDELDNIQRMFGKDGSNVSELNAETDKFNLVIEIAQLVEQLSRNFLRSQYKIGSVAVVDGDFRYSDYTMAETFNIGLRPFSVFADSIDKKHKRVSVHVNSGIKPYGEFDIWLSVNPQDSSYFDLNYHFNHIALAMFNPYATFYTSYPFNRGSIEISGKWNVDAGSIQSSNHLIIIDPRFAKRLKNDDTKWLPAPVALAVVLERGNVIDYEIPISGRLKDPNFDVKDAVFDALKNIFIRPITTPYRIEVKTTEREVEQSLSLRWDMQNAELTNAQSKFIKKMVHFLQETPAAEIQVAPEPYTSKEKEMILLFEAKKAYFLAKTDQQALTRSDSIWVSKMSIKDTLFKSYLNDRTRNSKLYTAQHKAEALISAQRVNSKFELLSVKRLNAFMRFFEDANVANRVVVGEAKSTIPFNGFSNYQISYSGGFPVNLAEAFEKMNALDGVKPRDEYQDKRELNAITP